MTGAGGRGKYLQRPLHHYSCATSPSGQRRGRVSAVLPALSKDLWAVSCSVLATESSGGTCCAFCPGEGQALKLTSNCPEALGAKDHC